jgi:hypothetical protein
MALPSDLRSSIQPRVEEVTSHLRRHQYERTSGAEIIVPDRLSGVSSVHLGSRKMISNPVLRCLMTNFKASHLGIIQ